MIQVKKISPIIIGIYEANAAGLKVLAQQAVN